MKNNYCVYKHTFPDGKVYIGMTECVADTALLTKKNIVNHITVLMANGRTVNRSDQAIQMQSMRTDKTH